MLHREIISVYSNINEFCWKKVEIFRVKPDGTYTDGYISNG